MESERRALLAVKSDMYDHGDRFSSWTGKDCCGWRGVACDNTTGHVTKLDLRYPCTKTFMRPIPYLYQYDTWHVFLTNETIGVSKVNLSLQELKHLKYLDLSSNNFALAPVPKMIAALVHLEYLDLSKAMFDGLIPPQFGNLSKLHHLDLGGWYDNRLQVDDLDWLSRIPSLKYLDMSSGGNYLSGDMPETLQSLRDLEYLDLSGNSNVSVRMPTWLGNLTSFAIFKLVGNKLIGGEIPPIVGDFTLQILGHLDMSYNNLSGQIPRTMDGLCNINFDS
ncbi:unnamed protein product [Musa textilis]